MRKYISYTHISAEDLHTSLIYPTLREIVYINNDKKTMWQNMVYQYLRNDLFEKPLILSNLKFELYSIFHTDF